MVDPGKDASFTGKVPLYLLKFNGNYYVVLEPSTR